MSIIRVDRKDFATRMPVVVIGGGGAGLTAALSAQDAGAEVLVVERDPTTLGSTAMSSSLLPAAGTRFQREAGVDDTAEQFLADILKQTRGQTDVAVARAVAEASAEAIEWLVDVPKLPLTLMPGPHYPGHSKLRMHSTPNRNGQDLMGALSRAAAETDLPILTEATVTDLFADGNGRILGLRYRRPDGTTDEVGCDVLVLACGGFGGNPALVAKHIPEMAAQPFFGHTGNKGDALLWGEALGAAVADLGGFQGHGGLAHGHNIPILWPMILLGGFQVNVRGERFGDEGRGPVEHAPDVAAQPGGVAWTIFDAERHTFMQTYDDYRSAMSAGCIVTGASWEELAGKLGLPAEALNRTAGAVAQAKAGKVADPFGRTYAGAHPLVAPYYGAKVTAALFHTQGGVRIDGQARVLRADGHGFPNLFAAGGAARGLSGPSYWGYMPGNGLISAFVIGRMAGLSAARQALRGGT